MFIEEKGKDILDKNLYKNFVLHVCNLLEFGVISSVEVFNTVKVNNTYLQLKILLSVFQFSPFVA